MTLRDELAALIELARRYTSLWYFMHTDALPAMRQVLTTLDQDVQRRVTFYGLDARPAAGEQTPLDGGSPSIPPQRNSGAPTRQPPAGCDPSLLGSAR